jgi:FkbM family methyltransferase
MGRRLDTFVSHCYRGKGLGIASDLQHARLAAFDRSELESAVKERVQTVHLGANRVLVRVLGKHKMFVSAEDLSFGCHLMLDGFWESWLTLFFAKFVKPGMTVFDVGANFGYYTLLFAAGVGPSGRVIAIEPVPATVSFLNDTVVLNGISSFTRVVAAAASNISGDVHLFVSHREPKNAVVIAARQEGSIIVPSCTIDQLAAQLPRVDLVKIDVEGSEMAVISGMRETIERCRPAILLEYNTDRYADPREFLELLLSTYGSVRWIGWDGSPKDVSPESILSTRCGEDWLLFFSCT